MPAALLQNSVGFALVIPGKPVGKGRPRHGNGRTWTPRETVLAEQEIRRKWQEAGEPRIGGPVKLTVHLAVTRPLGHYTSKGLLSAEGLRHPMPSRQKPDLDNAVKLVCDALNTRAYRDDVEIVELSALRFWDRPAYTRVMVEAAT